MKRIILILSLVSIIIGSANAQFVRIWEKSDALNNLPSWFSPTGTRERGIAFSVFNGIPKLFVISNLSEPTVIILDALTGDSLGTLNTDGIEGGILFLSDISSRVLGGFVSFDSRLYACNLTDNATITHFKIYVWETDTSAPQILYEDSISAFRIGDHLNLGIDFPRQHYITVSSNNNKIVDYYSETEYPPLIRKEITLSDGNVGSNASADYSWVYPFIFGGSYIVNSDGFSPKFYDTIGTMYSMSSLVPSSSNSIKYFANGTLCCDQPFYITYQDSENNAALVLSYGEPSSENFWGETPSLGNNPNPEHYGDVEYVWLNYYTLYIFVLSGNNGIGTFHAQGLATPVELISFEGKVLNDAVNLNWVTATEINNQGFEIEKQDNSKQSAVESWEKIGYVPGFGTTTESKSYSFIDENIKTGIYKYRLKQIDFDGSFEYSKEITIEVFSPIKFSLEQNYPNPFNPITTIKFALPVNSKVRINVYNSLGQLVETLVDKEMESGYHEANFDASRLASGVYLYQLQAGEYISVKKMLLLK